MRPGRSFPPPWTVEDHNDACFIVKDRGGQAFRASVSPMAANVAASVYSLEEFVRPESFVDANGHQNRFDVTRHHHLR